MSSTPAITREALLEELKADLRNLQALVDVLTPEELTGPIRTVNQVRAGGLAMAIRMKAFSLWATGQLRFGELPSIEPEQL
jgi:hypothetical protein